MALLAKPGRPGLQQRLVVAAVRLVTVATVFSNWCVLPEEGASRFSMTLLTLIIDRRMVELGQTRATMGTMTIRTLHLSAPDRVAKGTLDISTDAGVTVQTNPGLQVPVLIRFRICEIGMTGGTGHFGLFMGTAKPMITQGIGLVASIAHSRIVGELGMGILCYYKSCPGEHRQKQ
jgi:hypothetical protein